MPQKVIKFSGINRRVNEFTNIGACDELINIRPSATGMEVVKKKKVVCSATGYSGIVEHKFGAQSNLLAMAANAVVWIDLPGNVRQNISATSAPKDISCAGNVILVSFADGTQKSYKYENGSYAEFSTTLPDISISVELDGFDASVTYSSSTNFSGIEEAREGLSLATSLFYKRYHNGLAGPIVVGCTFELEDGNEVWSTGFSIIDPTRDARYVKPTTAGTSKITVSGAETAVLKFNVANYSKVTGVKNIRFYSSLPLYPYDMESSTGGYVQKKLANKELNIAGQNMYLQKVVSFRALGDFKLNTQYSLAAEQLMPVTSGMIYRTGDNVSYNNRFHFYNSNVAHTLQHMSSGVSSNIQNQKPTDYVTIRIARAYVVIDNGTERIFVRNNIPDVQLHTSYDFIYPIGGIKEGYIETSDNDFITSSWYKIELNDSTAYNYSCAIDCDFALTPCDRPTLTNLIESHGQSVTLKAESNAINVSAPYNPFIFPVQYSYSFGGKILDVATSYLPISSTQVGQYPLTVFTDNGIYALEQGSGSVLYGNVVPLQPLVISGKAVSSPYGTFFVSSKNIYVLSGREVANISYMLNGSRDVEIKGSAAYAKLCYGGNGLHDFSAAMSALDFDVFAMYSRLAYDQLNNELIISGNRGYSYVFNAATKAFHKTSMTYLQAASNSRYVIEKDGVSMNIVDLHDEITTISQNILIQSRPMSLEALYTHIDRMILLADATLDGSSGHNLCFSVFASDNLNDWKCIISAQKQNTVLRQIRTNRAAKSYKDYVILINGTVSSDTDLSDIIADYTVVSRRLG